MDRILHALTSSETWTNIGAFVVGWALAELRAWVAGRMRLRRWRSESKRTVPPKPPVTYDERELTGVFRLIRDTQGEYGVAEVRASPDAYDGLRKYIGDTARAWRMDDAQPLPDYGPLEAHGARVFRDWSLDMSGQRFVVYAPMTAERYLFDVPEQQTGATP